MKSFKQSEFHEFLKTNKVELKFVENSNKVVFHSNGKISEKATTDMIEMMDFYVRVIMDVQLFNYNAIDTLTEFSKDHVFKFVSNINYEYDVKDLVTASGPIWKSKQATSWVIVDIPYIRDNIASVNECVNAITAEYRNLCEKDDITGDDVFAFAKLLVRTKVVRYEDSFNTLLIANFQKATSYVYNAAVRVNLPKDVVENSKIEVADLIGCDLSIHNSEDTYIVDTVFDDRVRFCEIVTQRFVVKSEKMVLPHFASRFINIYKKDKTKALIRNINGAIEVGEIEFNIKEHPKSTTFLTDYILSFFSANTKLPQKTMRAVSNKVGKLLVSKLISSYCKLEA